MRMNVVVMERRRRNVAPRTTLSCAVIRQGRSPNRQAMAIGIDRMSVRFSRGRFILHASNAYLMK